MLRPVSKSPVEMPRMNMYMVKSVVAKRNVCSVLLKTNDGVDSRFLLADPCITDFDRSSAEVQHPSKWLWRKRFLCFVTWTLNRSVLLFRFYCLAGTSADAGVLHLLNYHITFHSIYENSYPSTASLPLSEQSWDSWFFRVHVSLHNHSLSYRYKTRWAF